MATEASGAETAPGRTQKYLPFRRASLLTVEQMRALNKLRPARAMRDTIMLWLQITAVWAVVAVFPLWWVVNLAIPVIGTRYYALYIIGHDGLHRRIFDEIRADSGHVAA